MILEMRLRYLESRPVALLVGQTLLMLTVIVSTNFSRTALPWSMAQNWKQQKYV